MVFKQWSLVMLSLLLLSGCASLALREPVNISVAGLEPLPSEGLEARFALKLRVQNPNDTDIDYDGFSVNLELADMHFGSGVSAVQGKVPRYGEALLTVPVTVPFTAIVRQFLDVTTGTPREKLSYRLRGRLGGIGFGGVGFDSRGELAMPAPRNGR